MFENLDLLLILASSLSLDQPQKQLRQVLLLAVLEEQHQVVEVVQEEQHLVDLGVEVDQEEHYLEEDLEERVVEEDHQLLVLEDQEVAVEQEVHPEQLHQEDLEVQVVLEVLNLQEEHLKIK